jgi:hypothetical protein
MIRLLIFGNSCSGNCGTIESKSIELMTAERTNIYAVDKLSGSVPSLEVN